MSSLLERLLGDDTPDEQVDIESRQADADGALRDAVERGGDAVEDCGVTGVAIVDEGPEGEPVVPIARFSLGEGVEAPDRDLVWDLVGSATGAMPAPFDDATAPVAWGACRDYRRTDDAAIVAVGAADAAGASASAATSASAGATAGPGGGVC